jgi:hypothetical protein
VRLVGLTLTLNCAVLMSGLRGRADLIGLTASAFTLGCVALWSTSFLVDTAGFASPLLSASTTPSAISPSSRIGTLSLMVDDAGFHIMPTDLHMFDMFRALDIFALVAANCLLTVGRPLSSRGSCALRLSSSPIALAVHAASLHDLTVPDCRIVQSSLFVAHPQSPHHSQR